MQLWAKTASQALHYFCELAGALQLAFAQPRNKVLALIIYSSPTDCNSAHLVVYDFGRTRKALGPRCNLAALYMLLVRLAVNPWARPPIYAFPALLRFESLDRSFTRYLCAFICIAKHISVCKARVPSVSQPQPISLIFVLSRSNSIDEQLVRLPCTSLAKFFSHRNASTVRNRFVRVTDIPRRSRPRQENNE